MPAIPHQRALIAWRDGLETLVVETTYDTPSPSVGWVLPLPAEPVELKAGDPGMLTSLAMSLRPEITNDLSADVWLLACLAVFAAVMAATWIFIRDVAWRVILSLLWMFGLVVFPCITSTAGRHMSAGGAAPDGVTVAATQRVGDYEVTVLRAERAEALSEWLRGQGLRALDAPARAVVDDYIARKWCFAVARLVREAGGGAATGHPIAATFPAAQPVYPMKMTSLAGSTTRVELFVVADRQARAGGFHTAAADLFAHDERLGRHLAGGGWEGSDVLCGRHAWFVIGSPDAVDYMWPGCVVTRLRADLAPAAMDRDVQIGWTDLSPRRDHVFSARGRRHVVTEILLGGAVLLAAYCAVVFYKRGRVTAARLTGGAAVVAAALVAAVVTWFALPVVPTVAAPRGAAWAWQGDLRYTAAAKIKRGELHADMTTEEVAAALTETIPQRWADTTEWQEYYLTNPYSGRRVVPERSPGNFSVRRSDGKAWFCVYDENGAEYRHELPPPPGPAGQPAERPGDLPTHPDEAP
jgi:hypothetical protein